VPVPVLKRILHTSPTVNVRIRFCGVRELTFSS
jgi:hypothetical protein